MEMFDTLCDEAQAHKKAMIWSSSDKFSLDDKVSWKMKFGKS